MSCDQPLPNFTPNTPAPDGSCGAVPLTPQGQISPKRIAPFLFIIPGTLFGLLLYKANAVSPDSIRAMFQFKEAHLYLVIASAVATGALSLQILKRLKFGKFDGSQMPWPSKPLTKGLYWGGCIFGAGWYIAGACPGPITVQLGAGAWPALFTFAGVLLGTYFYARFRSKLPH